VTNAPAPSASSIIPTNQPLYSMPIAAPVTNAILWASTNTQWGAVTPAVQAAGQAVYNAVNTAANQSHSDAAVAAGAAHNDATNTAAQSHADAAAAQAQGVADANGIISAINRASALNHSDVANVSRGVALAGGLAHSDAGSIVDAIRGLGTNTGGSTMTNYALETTQEKSLGTQVGISNLLSRMVPGGTNNPDGQLAAGNAAAINGSNMLMGLVIDDRRLDQIDEGYGTAPSSEWSISIPYMGGYSVDVNPFHKPFVVALAAFMRMTIRWASIVGVCLWNINVLAKALNALGATRQATSAANVPLASAGTALIMATIISVVMVAVPAFGIYKLWDYLGVLRANPFAGTVDGPLACSLWLVDQFFPIAVIVGCVIAKWSFTAALDAVVWAVQTITRFLVG
jgi:hypothetical protein